MKFVEDIGRGGLGIVRLYRHEKSGNPYAVKFMLEKWDDHLYKRFVQEIRLMTNLVHDNIMKILKYDVKNENPHYVMPYYRDGSLRDRLNDMKANGKVFSVQAATSIIYVLAEALSYAHQRGAIHRDFKPENILFNGREPILADWGIGKFIHRDSPVLTKTNGKLGTQPYCAPEQWSHGLSDARSDIYSMGLVYRELLTGKIDGTVSDLKIAAIIRRMTTHAPEDRYQSMDQVLAELRNLHVVNETDPMDSFWSALGAIGIAAGVALVVGGLISLLFNDED